MIKDTYLRHGGLYMKNNKNGKRIIWTILSTIMAASIILGDFMPGAVIEI